MAVYDDASSTVFSGSGSGFSATGSGFGGGFAAGFNVGDTVNISRRLSFAPTFADPGQITSNGVTQHGYLTGTLQLTAAPFVVSSVTSQPLATQTFTTPFTLSGTVELLAQPFGQSLVTQQVTATGTAEFDAKNIGPGGSIRFVTDSGPTSALSLTFAPASPPVTPEPSTLLLLGAGVLGLWQSKRRRRAP